MRIELATTDDAPAAAAVHAASATVAYADIFPSTATPPTPADLTPGWVEMIDNPRGAVFVARHDGRVVGVAALASDPERSDGLFLTRLYVHPDHWHRGYGSELHDRAVAVGLERAASLKLWVLEANTSARRMYERRGWQLVPDRYLANDPPEVKDVLYILIRNRT